MPRFSIASFRQRLKGGAPGAGWNARVVARLVLGVLVVANLIAAVIVLKPWAGSADSLEQQAASLRKQLRKKQIEVGKLRSVANKVQSARTDGDNFMDSYLLSRRTVSSTLVEELDQMARKAGIKQKEVTFAFEPVEGSEALTRADITAGYEGAYADLTHFLNLLDRSSRLLIIDSLAATPQPQGQLLSVTIKLSAFVREGVTPGAERASAQAPGRTQ
jgi:Tfp pilus assembly protein PilO